MYRDKLQQPLWEMDEDAIYEKYMNKPEVDNLAELYTAWSRAIYIDPEQDFLKGFSCSMVKLMEVRHDNQFLEPMTLWRLREEKGESYFLPRKHAANQSLWRSFGLIAQTDGSAQKEGIKKPGITAWLTILKEISAIKNVTLCGVGMESDGNASSWTPINEIYDELNMDEEILLADKQEIWRNRINHEVELTKQVIEIVYGRFLRSVEQIRYGESKGNLLARKKEEAYFLIDEPFRAWLAGIHEGNDIDERCRSWRRTLKEIMIAEGDKNAEGAGTKEYLGVHYAQKGDKQKETHFINLPIALNIYRAGLTKALGEETKNDEIVYR